MAMRLVKGNEAVVIGALYAGCDAYFGYPITPASEIAQLAAEYFPRLGRVFLQAECETASVNMVYGAAAAGTLAMTASSGPGISLMQEGISYLAGAELPCVIVNIMRGGPGLGNIGPEQSDYQQAVKGGGHGCYRNLVLAPGSVQEMCDFTRLAFDLAFKYRNPAFVIADGVLGQMMEPIALPPGELPRPDCRAWATQATAETRHNLLTSIYLDHDDLEAHNHHLQAKYAQMAADARHEEFLTTDADLILVAYGICSRLARTAVEHARDRGLKLGLFRPQTLFPFPAKALQNAARGRRLLVCELSCGQLRDDLLLQLGPELAATTPLHLLNRMGGNLLTVAAIVAKAAELLNA
ncbi:MAG: 3-methyl-2-oxobutanoate dehydrogenase subunit VorB [Lentisphaeria bacterium]|jgi:2-oxoisovalerate ferredoxin oxidoreductase alpha subunit